MGPATHPSSGKVPVLVAAAGATWEADALDRLSRGGPGVVLLKRCVDLPDLLATAATGLAGVAVVSGSLSGLDVDAVTALGLAGLGVVLVDDLRAGSGRAAEESARLARLGASAVLEAAAVGLLVAAVRDAAAHAGEEERGDARVRAVPESDGAGEPGPTPQRGVLVAVWGPAGAPGRTTLAVGLAAEAAARGERVLLLDADPYSGAVAQHLGVLDEASGLLGAARAANSGSLDVARLATYARQVTGRLAVLTGLPRADRWTEVRPRAFEELLAQATGLADRVVVDTGFSLERGPADPFDQTARNAMTTAALERADEVVVVGAADPVGLARLARALVELHELRPAARLRVVVNRVRPSLGWGERELRGMVEGFVTPLDVHFLPDDRGAADRALMAGRSLLETGDSSLRAALSAVADGLLGEPQRAARVRRRRAGRAR